MRADEDVSMTPSRSQMHGFLSETTYASPNLVHCKVQTCRRPPRTSAPPSKRLLLRRRRAAFAEPPRPTSLLLGLKRLLNKSQGAKAALSEVGFRIYKRHRRDPNLKRLALACFGFVPSFYYWPTWCPGRAQQHAAITLPTLMRKPQALLQRRQPAKIPQPSKVFNARPWITSNPKAQALNIPKETNLIPQTSRTSLLCLGYWNVCPVTIGKDMRRTTPQTLSLCFRKTLELRLG